MAAHAAFHYLDLSTGLAWIETETGI